MHEELEVGARARLPDAEEKPSDGKKKKKLQFEKEELDGVSEDKNADSSSFSDKETNTKNADTGKSSSKRMSRLEERSECANEKVEQAKEKLPTKKKIKKQRLYDEESGKGKTKLSFEDEVVQPKTGKGTVVVIQRFVWCQLTIFSIKLK